MALRSFNVINLCAGVGGLDLGLKIAVPATRTVCYVEREAFAVACLVNKIKAGVLDEAPVWSDLATFDGRPWRGRVHCLAASLPCQPYSCAGQRKGHDDERAIWPLFIRVAKQITPPIIWLENVPEFIKHFQPVGRALSRMGYTINPGVFGAAEVGAPHLRKRLFVLAHAPEHAGFREIARSIKVDFGADMGHPNLTRWQRRGLSERETFSQLSAWPPVPAGDWRGIPQELEPAVRGVANGLAPRMDRLRACGNGVVPLQAAYAFRFLAQQVGMI